MKVKELISELRQFDGEMEVEVDEDLAGMHDMYIQTLEDMGDGKVTMAVRHE